ncbi:MAG TPA: hypothetical protein VI457_01195 [Methylococcaceae bacterium]|nr:hypothetical protein [Methylococcaceae bacterium]
MKTNKLTLAVLSALGLSAFAGAAFAYGPSENYDYELRISGASAQDDAVEALFNTGATGLCLSDRDVWSYNNSKSDYRAVSCKTDAGKVPGLTDTNGDGLIKVLIFKRSHGGSALGVQPLARDMAISGIDKSTCTAGSTVAGATYNCTGLTSVTSDVGVSDVDPGIFRNVDNTPSEADAVLAGVNFPMTDVDVANLEVKSAAALIFGMPVTLNFRDALQDAMIANLTLDATCDDSAANRDLESCMPSLAKSAIASVMTGVLADWSQLGVPGLAMPTSGDTAPKLCRRVNGSGTQASYNVKILDNPCKGALSGASMGGHDGFNVFENSTSGDVRTCLNTQYTAGNYAIGLLSVESKPSGTRNFRWIKVDGVSPSLQNAAEGKYPIVVEQTFQWRKSTVSNPLSGGKLKIAEAIVSNAANPTSIAARNAAFTYAGLETGYLATLPNTTSATVPFTTAAPVWGYSHAANGNTLDNCRLPQVYDPGTSVPATGL